MVGIVDRKDTEKPKDVFKVDGYVISTQDLKRQQQVINNKLGVIAMLHCLVFQVSLEKQIITQKVIAVFAERLKVNVHQI